VKSGARVCALPLTGVVETLRVEESSFGRVRGHNVLTLRDRVIPVEQLDSALGDPPRPLMSTIVASFNLVVVRSRGTEMALAVDAFRRPARDRAEVTQPGHRRAGRPGRSTVMADGAVGLVVDIAALLDHSATRAAPPPESDATSGRPRRKSRSSHSLAASGDPAGVAVIASGTLATWGGGWPPTRADRTTSGPSGPRNGGIYNLEIMENPILASLPEAEIFHGEQMPSGEHLGHDTQGWEAFLMAMDINTNIDALNALRNLGTTSTAFSSSVAKLSSGLRINTAADDAAGLAIATKLQSQVTGLDQAQRNAQDGVSMVPNR